ASRAVPVGTPATVFATIINAGSAAAIGCSVAPAATYPVAFQYQTTDARTNQLTGTANTPVDIPAGQSQSFVLSLTPTPTFGTAITLSFRCANASHAPFSTVNTLGLLASPKPVADIVALAATPSQDGIVWIPGPTGQAAFAIATANVGAGDLISVIAEVS